MEDHRRSWMVIKSHASKVSDVNIFFGQVTKSNGRPWKVIDSQRRSWKIMEGYYVRSARSFLG